MIVRVTYVSMEIDAIEVNGIKHVMEEYKATFKIGTYVVKLVLFIKAFNRIATYLTTPSVMLCLLGITVYI